METIRPAAAQDIDAITAIYDAIHTAEENGETTIGWLRGVYPVRGTAGAALDRGDLFVMTDGDAVVGAAVINQLQVDAYSSGDWLDNAPAEQVMVLHTLVIDPARKGQGFGSRFVRFYEQYALENDCPYLRMDTNARNLAARRLYHSLGYREAGIVPCVFNGLKDVQLVLLEKRLTALPE